MYNDGSGMSIIWIMIVVAVLLKVSFEIFQAIRFDGICRLCRTPLKYCGYYGERSRCPNQHCPSNCDPVDVATEKVIRNNKKSL